MPTVNLNKTEFEDLVGKKLPLEELKDRISMLGTDLEKIEGNEIEVEIFPNRPDMLSEQGFARAFSSFIGVKGGLRKYNVRKSNYEVKIEKSVKGIRPETACAVVKNLKLDDDKIKSIIQIQEKLHVSYGRNRKKVAIGIYPLEKIKFPIRYLAEDPKRIEFKPLEMTTVLNGKEILEKHPVGRDYKHLLEKEDKFPIFRDANESILSMPPIINSDDVGKVSADTKEVFVECSGFDYETLSKCLNFIVTALNDIGGEIYEVKVDGKESPDLTPEEMKFDLGYCNKILGLELKENEVKGLLEKMGYDYVKGKVLIPAYRADILHQIDLVEDIAIAYGYENFKEEIPNVSTVAKESERRKLNRKISEVLMGLGLLECNSFSLSNEDNLNKKMQITTKLMKVESPVNQDYNTLRDRILPNLMEILSENKRYEYPHNLFEIGKIFEGVKDKDSLGVVITGNFTELKQVLDVLFRSLNLEYMVEETEHRSFISGRCGRISAKGKDLGVIGELSPDVLENWGLEIAFSGLELDIERLFDIIRT
ncbi:MAG: phenylalanine--tRNA ligase subunit beta [Nanoarchaeota archaeon]|nr:phenylalanine--tRNA ligase subunit beta [Nanoarchaeota archaeon]|tara:strand:- start:13098 stop:14708 length:1611 start_codon:yes stop_codon:yes gene_type:complete